MSKIILSVLLAMSFINVYAAEAKKTCIDQVDPKTQKTKQVCKSVKVHKKLDTTNKVPAK